MFIMGVYVHRVVYMYARYLSCCSMCCIGQSWMKNLISLLSAYLLPQRRGGYRGGSPTAVRPSDPALCGSCPL